MYVDLEDEKELSPQHDDDDNVVISGSMSSTLSIETDTNSFSVNMPSTLCISPFIDFHLDSAASSDSRSRPRVRRPNEISFDVNSFGISGDIERAESVHISKPSKQSNGLMALDQYESAIVDDHKYQIKAALASILSAEEEDTLHLQHAHSDSVKYSAKYRAKENANDRAKGLALSQTLLSATPDPPTVTEEEEEVDGDADDDEESLNGEEFEVDDITNNEDAEMTPNKSTTSTASPRSDLDVLSHLLHDLSSEDVEAESNGFCDENDDGDDILNHLRWRRQRRRNGSISSTSSGNSTHSLHSVSSAKSDKTGYFNGKRLRKRATAPPIHDRSHRGPRLGLSNSATLDTLRRSYSLHVPSRGKKKVHRLDFNLYGIEVRRDRRYE